MVLDKILELFNKIILNSPIHIKSSNDSLKIKQLQSLD